MRIGIIAPEGLRKAIYRRHLESLGHVVVDEQELAAGRGSASYSEPATVVADLTSESRRTEHAVSELHRRFPNAASIVLLRGEQTLAAEDAVGLGVHALLREPVRLDDLDVHVAGCEKAWLQRRRTAIPSRETNAREGPAAETEVEHGR
jgi:DNA-binding NarL/FixJ family response regulator